MAKADSEEISLVRPGLAPLRGSPARASTTSEQALAQVIAVLSGNLPARAPGQRLSAPAGVSQSLYGLVVFMSEELTQKERQLLWPFAAPLSCSGLDYAAEGARLLKIADWTVREALLLAVEAEGLGPEADFIRKISPITNRKSALCAAASAADVRDSAENAGAGFISACACFAADSATSVGRSQPGTNFARKEGELIAFRANAAGKEALAAGANRTALINSQIDLIDHLCSKRSALLEMSTSTLEVDSDPYAHRFSLIPC